MIQNPKIFWMTVRLLMGLSIVISIFCFTFTPDTSMVGLSQIVFLSILGIMYVALGKQYICEINKTLRAQYGTLKKYYEQFGTAKQEYTTSYLQYVLGIFSDERHVVGWFANILFYICAPISLFAYTYSLFCNLGDLTYIISFVSIALALYSVWKTIDLGRDTTKKLDKIICNKIPVPEYKEEEPNNSNNEEWIVINNKL